MRPLILSAIGLALVMACGRVRAAAVEPDTRPAAQQPDAVLILPFVVPADAKFKSVGADIQQDLATAIGPNLRGRVLAPTTEPAAGDEQSARAAARDAHAAAVVFGRVQANADEVRITGQVLDVGIQKPLGNLKVTGPADHLFELEDALAPQVAASLPTALLNFRGLAMASRINPPRVIYLSGDAAISTSPNAPIDGGYAGTIPPPAPLVAPGGPPPYSPYAESYPYRFRAPYAYLFSYDYDPDPFLPLYGPWRWGPDRFAGHGTAHHHSHGARR
jgi:TolB-like protein